MQPSQRMVTGNPEYFQPRAHRRPGCGRAYFRFTLFAALVIGACDPPTPVRAVLPTGLDLQPTFEDIGRADPNATLRAVIALPIRNPAALEMTIEGLYERGSPTFRQYLSADAWNEQHAPPPEDIDAVVAWLEAGGLAVPRVARNRLLLHVTGTVGAFETAFETTLHRYRKIDDPDFETFGTQDKVWAPADIARRLESIVAADHPADPSPLPGESGGIELAPPPDLSSLTVDRLAGAYGFEPLYDQGRRGEGITIGVVAGAAFKFFDVQSFWQAQGIVRADPVLIPTMEPLSTRFTETTLDIEWAGALAPAAEVLVYAGPDAHETSLVYTFNAAISEGRVHVITDSFAHREDATPAAIRRQYHASAQMAAALGITVVAAGGDSGEPDVPSSSPYVTSVGGTVLQLDANGARREELAWARSGSGESLQFDAPAWQHAPTSKRAVSDVALAAGSRYWTYVFGEWRAYAGTSFSSPVFAAMIAVIDSARRAEGKPVVGYLNSTLYRDTAVQATFHDVVLGSTDTHAAGVGWDYPTGWGAPHAAALAGALP